LPIGGDRGIQGALYDSHNIIFITEDMRVVAKAERIVNNDGLGWVGVNIRLPDLDYIEDILHIQCKVTPIPADPTKFMEPINKTIVGNVVGMSIYNSTAGTTVTIDVIAVGPP